MGIPVDDNDIPLDNEALTYVSADKLWKAIAGGGGGQSNDGANVGTGDGIYRDKTGVIINMKSIIGETNKIIVTANADDLTLTIGSNVFTTTNRQTGITNAELAGSIAQSKIIDLVSDLANKIDSGDTITLPHWIPCQMIVPEGTVAYPDIVTLATASAKSSGAILPDGASVSTYNFKPMFPLPSDLHGTPNLKIHFELVAMGTEATNRNTRMTVKSRWNADGEDINQALTAETETTVQMPATINKTKIYSQTISATIAIDDTGIFQLSRDPTDASDVFPQDVWVKSVWITCDRSITL